MANDLKFLSVQDRATECWKNYPCDTSKPEEQIAFIAKHLIAYGEERFARGLHKGIETLRPLLARVEELERK